ncbi:MAG: hypothetical protein OCC46_02780 [Pseudodesulfovibrio sp.]
MFIAICLMCLAGCGSGNEKKPLNKATANVSDLANVKQPQSGEEPQKFGADTYENQFLESQGITEDDNIMDVMDKAMEGVK